VTSLEANRESPPCEPRSEIRTLRPTSMTRRRPTRRPVRRALLAAGVLLLALSALPARAGVVSVAVDGDTAVAELAVAGVAAELTLTFEDAVGLTAESLGLSVQEVLPLDTGVTSRLPALTSLPAGFPLLVRIEPPAGGPLSFRGVVTVELYTHALSYTPGCPLRLFSAPLGGAFRDVTEDMGAGSYRVRGGKGDFSEFLILAEARPVDSVIAAKLGRLDDLLTAHGGAIEPSVLVDLEDLAASARSSYESGQLVPAIQKVEAFERKVENHGGADVPDVWRSARDLTNVAGELRAAARTLHFSLLWTNNGL